MTFATLLISLAVAIVGAFAIEATASPQRPSLRPADLSIRFLGYALITLFWFQFSWRPWLAASSCLLTLAILSVVDQLKRKVIGEPVVFSDLALLAQVPRHPQLYYTLPLTDLRIAGPLLIGLATVIAWYVLEPAALPEGAGASALAILGLPAGLAALALLGLSPFGQAALRRLFPRPDLARDVARYGLVATMMGYGLRRLGEMDARPLAGIGGEPDDEVVVVVQLESFLDPTRLGGPDLPLMARIRSQAAQYGRLAVPAHGAYTMRSEHAVLTGLDPDDLGFGRYDPYLARKGEEPTSLARLARASGFATVFVHPFHRDFFDRAQVFRRLGFDHLVMEEDFGNAPRFGPYISDVAVAERILAEVAPGGAHAPGGRRFVFSVTMENHGPWKPGRLTGIDEPLAQYLHHVAHTGQAVERLIDGLAGRRATLCVFGDHAPSLPDCPPLPSGPVATDYALFRFGREDGQPPVRLDLTAAQLGCVLRDALAPKRTGLRG